MSRNSIVARCAPMARGELREDLHALGHRRGAGGQRLRRLLHFHETHAAVRRDRELLVIAEARHVRVGSARSVARMIISPFCALHGLAVDLDVDEIVAHAACAPRFSTMLRAAVVDHVLELVTEVLQEALHRPRGGIAERADGVAFDAVRHIEQQAQLFAARLRLRSRASAGDSSSPCLHGTACTGRRTRTCRSARCARARAPCRWSRP